MKRIIVAAVLALLAGLPAFSQSPKKSKSVRKPTIRATVTVKGDGNFPPVPKASEENEVGLWNEFVVERYRTRILFPARPGDVESFPIADGRTHSYAAYTANAAYKLIIIAHDPPLDDLQASLGLENLLNAPRQKPGSRLVAQRPFAYAGRRGFHLEEESHGSFVISRMFPLNGIIFVVSAVVEDKSKRNAIEPWVNKFLDSLEVEVAPLIEGE